MIESILKLANVTQSELSREVLKAAVEGLTLAQLSEMGKAYEKAAQKLVPLRPQLAPLPNECDDKANVAYRI